MKLATLRDGSRDGHLVVVSDDLTLAHYATGIATRLQQVLDDWTYLSPLLQDLAVALNHGKARHAFAFDPRHCLAPLPRPLRRLSVHEGRVQEDGSGAWLGPVAPLPTPSAAAAPSGRSEADAAASDRDSEAGIDDDGLRGPDGAADPASGPQAAGADDHRPWHARWAVITGDIPAWAGREQALEGVRLLALEALAGPPGQPPQGALPHAFAVAVTPDALGAAWHRGTLQGHWQRRRLGRRAEALHAGDAEAATDVGRALALAARGRALPAGTVLSVTLPVQWGVAPGLWVAGDAERGEAALRLGSSGELLEWTAEDAQSPGQTPFGALHWSPAEAAADEAPTAPPPAPPRHRSRAPTRVGVAAAPAGAAEGAAGAEPSAEEGPGERNGDREGDRDAGRDAEHDAEGPVPNVGLAEGDGQSALPQPADDTAPAAPGRRDGPDAADGADGADGGNTPPAP